MHGKAAPWGVMRMLTKTLAQGRIFPALGADQRLTAAMRACAGWAAIEEHDKILDMSCGSGALLRRLNDQYRLTLCGMSESPEAAREAREGLPDADVIAARLEDIPWRDDTFDIVMLSAGLRGDARRVVGEAHRVLKAGGQFVLAAPLFSPKGEGNYTRREQMRLMQEAGFREVSFRASGLCGAIVGWKERK